MLHPRMRGNIYWLEGRVTGKRLRLSLGTRNRSVAMLAAGNIERGLLEGAPSAAWPDLRRILPDSTFARLAGLVGYVERADPGMAAWKDLADCFVSHIDLEMARGKLKKPSWENYIAVIKKFSAFLKQQSVDGISCITAATIEGFKAQRMRKILSSPNHRGGGGLELDLVLLRRIFNFAIERELLTKNPIRIERSRRDNAKLGAQPFSGKELRGMRKCSGQYSLQFLLFRWTGMRISDVVGLKWENVDWQRGGISCLTQKNSRLVWLPIAPELMVALEAEHERLHPKPGDHILLSKQGGGGMTTRGLYGQIRTIGNLAGVDRAHPHRFRDTFAVDMLLRGASPYDVAKLLGDTIRTVEIYYAPFVQELRERARGFIEGGGGLEDAGTYRAQRRSWHSQPA